VVLAAQPGHLGADRVGGQHRVLAVEGLGFLGDGEVLIGDGAAGDLGVVQGHVQAAVPEHRRDGLQAHPAVDGLGGQRVPQLAGVDAGQPGGGAGLAVVAGHGVPAGRLAVLPRQQQRVGRAGITGSVVIDQGGQVRVQRQVAVLAELADRDVQPRPGADLHHISIGCRPVRDASRDSRESFWSRHGEHLGVNSARWTGLAPLTRIPEQIHSIVTGPRHASVSPVGPASTYPDQGRPAAGQLMAMARTSRCAEP
jgi:hypothetical protein